MKLSKYTLDIYWWCIVINVLSCLFPHNLRVIFNDVFSTEKDKRAMFGLNKNMQKEGVLIT